MKNSIEPQPQILRSEEWLSLTPFSQGHFDGRIFGTNVSVLRYVQEKPGDGPSLHVHEYDEIFVILRGHGVFKIGDKVIEAAAGDVLYGPARVPHKFKNIGSDPLETLDIHLNDRWVQEDLEDNDPDW